MMKKHKRNTKAKEKIWDFLLDNAGEELYSSQISRSAAVAGTTTYDVLERGVKDKLLQKKSLAI